jgi:signal peptidase II
MLIWLAVIIVTVFLDQLTKYLTVLHLKPIDTLPIIEDVFHLTYVENTGAAFGMMKDARWVFMITSTAAIIGILGYMIHRYYVKKEKLHWAEALSLSLIVGGGIGNMIDRTMLGYVVDMIDCRFINFAVFNVADSFVCIGAGLMILYLIILTVREYKAEKAAKLALAEGEELPESADAATDGAFAAEETTLEAEGDIDTIEERVEDTTEGGDHE